MKPPTRLWLGSHFPVFSGGRVALPVAEKGRRMTDLGSKIIALLLAISTGVQCQDRVDQKPVEVIKEGEDSIIACQFTSNNFYSMHWYRQYPGEAPAFLLTVTSGKLEKHEHLSASFDRQKRESRLNITKVQMKDATVYFCGAQDPQQHRGTCCL
ncbi:hypothetical protein E2320_003512 [Naja naja]|nr:hypothetical protein E2320_003512 [Naja naja]